MWCYGIKLTGGTNINKLVLCRLGKRDNFYKFLVLKCVIL